MVGQTFSVIDFMVKFCVIAFDSLVFTPLTMIFLLFMCGLVAYNVVKKMFLAYLFLTCVNSIHYCLTGSNQLPLAADLSLT